MQWLETRISELRSTVPERRAALEAERARYAKRHGLDRANMKSNLERKKTCRSHVSESPWTTDCIRQRWQF